MNVAAAPDAARRAGFTRSCEDDVGRLLAVLTAAVPVGGRILELGTGTGVGLAWITSGLVGRDDVEVLSVEHDARLAALAATGPWPPGVRIETGDALDVLARSGTFDLIFADAPAGKTTGLAHTLAALRPGGVLVVDDMAPRPDDPFDDEVRPRLEAVAVALRADDRLVIVELAWASGVIVATRRR